MDLISRQKAIDVLIGAVDAFGVLDAEDIKAVFAMLPSEPQWISCGDGLPYAEYGESDNVLATCGHRDADDTGVRWIKTLYFNGGTWCYPTGETYTENVYAWMQLPEPYRGGTEK